MASTYLIKTYSTDFTSHNEGMCICVYIIIILKMYTYAYFFQDIKDLYTFEDLKFDQQKNLLQRWTSYITTSYRVVSGKRDKMMTSSKKLIIETDISVQVNQIYF